MGLLGIFGDERLTTHTPSIRLTESAAGQGVSVMATKVSLYKREQAILREVSLTVGAGEWVAFLGFSGAGKTSLLRCLAGLEAQVGGEVQCLAGEVLPLVSYGGIHYVYQQVESAFNPCLPLEISLLEGLRQQGISRIDALESLKVLLEGLEIPTTYLARYPHEVSGGEGQRLALVRALSTRPRLLLCDEITSALDEENGHKVMQLFRQVCRPLETTVILATHDLQISRYCDRTGILEQGILAEYGETEKFLGEPESEAGQALVEAMRYFTHFG